MAIKSYISMMRINHWFKNMFVLPGTILALVLTGTPFSQIIPTLILGLLSACIIASSNYVINEWVDAAFDRFHPRKKHRTAVVTALNPVAVYLVYFSLVIIGLILASFVSLEFLYVIIFFFIMGVIYNIRPMRAKDKPYLDVAVESINNPIRFLLGWFIVTNSIFPPSSLLLGYWCGGAFLMSIKRYAELRAIKDLNIAGLYRNSFKFYTEEKLLLMSFFYAMSSAFFLGVFLVKYRTELVFSLPFFAILFTWYLYIGLKPNSAAQHPEHLYREKNFAIYVVVFVVVIVFLLLCDFSGVKWLLSNAFIEGV